MEFKENGCLIVFRKNIMRKQFIAAFALVAVTSASTSIHAQNFGSFKAGISELSINSEVVLEKEADAVRYPISQSDSRIVLKESEEEHFALGKVALSKATVILYYTKPQGQAPLGKISIATFSSSGKKIASEAIGVFADFAGMHFNTSIRFLAQDKGAVAVTSDVTALKDNGEVNSSMSKTSTYYVTSKGKILKQ